ncbi:hypothetical protein F4054_20285 [Candidatus Poribacteria bacterium]|nr:hypothetical protein [Candidatus Poribacteria bacterium]MYG05936.1 hypothetical protein [Candidatus Poribacteria bacterium]MYK24585.1 hypothetical protein [Candidatus Poribacteria bacterium]
MFRDMFSGSRAILFGLVFFFIVVGGSLLYSWHVHRMTDAEVAEAHRKLQSLKNKNEARTTEGTVNTSTVAFEHAETNLETDDAQMSDDTGVSPIDETSEALDMSDAFLPDDFVSEEAPAEDGPVSPFGFGPYPDVPADFRIPLSWNLPEETLAKWDENIQIQMELMGRVFIKLWNQGHTGLGGGTFENGLVLPLYPRTAYVLYEEEWTKEDFGDSHTTTVEILADSSVSEKEKEQIRNGETPTGIRILDYQLDGINPYTFLDLPELK